MKAVILAGGLGRRLEPLTVIFPKVLAPVGEVPILEIVLRKLQRSGFTEVTLALGHLGELVEAYVAAHRARFDGLDIRTVYEEAPTGTAGAVALVPGLDETFLVMNGDVLTDLDFPTLVAAHRESGALLSIAATRQTHRVESGVLDFGADGRLERYEEKPELSFTVSMGIYVYEPAALDAVPRGRPVDQPEVIGRLLERGLPVHCAVSDCAWYDIGTRAGYRQACERFAREPERFLPAARRGLGNQLRFEKRPTKRQ